MKNYIFILIILLSFGCDRPNEVQKTEKLTITIDSSLLHIKLSLRRLNTIFKADSLDRLYYVNASLYYKTNKEKYRIRANKAHDDYILMCAFYQRQQDSLTRNIIK